MKRGKVKKNWDKKTRSICYHPKKILINKTHSDGYMKPSLYFMCFSSVILIIKIRFLSVTILLLTNDISYLSSSIEWRKIFSINIHWIMLYISGNYSHIFHKQWMLTYFMFIFYPIKILRMEGWGNT